MEHLPIIQALCRAALASGGPAVRRQVERLRDAAREQDDVSATKSLEQLLSQAGRMSELAPSRLTQSRVSPEAATLTRNSPVPVDKETSAPVAEVLFEDSLPAEMPHFSEALSKAAAALINEWRHADELTEAGAEPARTCLLYGPPGTGKTTLALWMAGQLGVPVVVARLDGLISSFLGSTARNVGNLFAFANRHRCVLLLDEFDAIAKVRDDPHEVGEIKRVVNALLQNIDARRSVGITIASTNHETLLDPAVWRRFEVQLEIPKPDFTGRLAIARMHLPPIEIGNAGERLVAWVTEGMSGADVRTFTLSMKKSIVLGGKGGTDLVECARQQVILNGSRIAQDRGKALTGEPQDLADALRRDKHLDMTQAEIGQLMGRDKTTIGRWLKQAA